MVSFDKEKYLKNKPPPSSPDVQKLPISVRYLQLRILPKRRIMPNLHLHQKFANKMSRTTSCTTCKKRISRTRRQFTKLANKLSWILMKKSFGNHNLQNLQKIVQQKKHTCCHNLQNSCPERQFAEHYPEQLFAKAKQTTRSQKRFIKEIIAEFALFTWSLVTLFASTTKSTVFA